MGYEESNTSLYKNQQTPVGEICWLKTTKTQHLLLKFVHPLVSILEY